MKNIKTHQAAKGTVADPDALRSLCGRSSGRVWLVETIESERDKIAAKARKLCADPVVAAEWRAAWCRVLDRLQPIYAARRPVLKSFEVHHSNETAREAMLRALVAGKPMEECEIIAFETANSR